MRTLNGQIEDISFRLSKLGERFEQIAADTEFRFQELEMLPAKELCRVMPRRGAWRNSLMSRRS